MADAAIHGHDHEDNRSFFTRWFMSTNHKDIGMLYLIVSALVGLIALHSLFHAPRAHGPGCAVHVHGGARCLRLR